MFGEIRGVVIEHTLDLVPTGGGYTALLLHSDSALGVVADIFRVLRLHNGVLLHGAVGVGQRHLLKALAGCLGRHCLEVSELACDPAASRRLLNSVLNGAWMLLDECAALAPEAAQAALGQHILALLDRQRQQRQRQTGRTRPRASFFLLATPHLAANRTNRVADTLRAAFRPVSMPQLDARSLIVARLQASNAPQTVELADSMIFVLSAWTNELVQDLPLSIDVVNLILDDFVAKLNQQQCSATTENVAPVPSMHRDQLATEDAANSAPNVLGNAMLRHLEPLLLDSSLVLLLRSLILQTLPSVSISDCPAVPAQVFSALCEFASSRHLGNVDAWVDKASQLYDALQHASVVLVVGAPRSGKSALVDAVALASSNTTIEGSRVAVHIERVCSRSRPSLQRYKRLLTRHPRCHPTWLLYDAVVDKHADALVRHICRRSLCPCLPPVLEGVVDHDCLQNKLVLETTSAAALSPSSLAMLRVVCVPNDIVEWRVTVETWCQERMSQLKYGVARLRQVNGEVPMIPEAAVDRLRSFIIDSCTPVLDFITEHCQLLFEFSDEVLIKNCLALFDMELLRLTKLKATSVAAAPSSLDTKHQRSDLRVRRHTLSKLREGSRLSPSSTLYGVEHRIRQDTTGPGNGAPKAWLWSGDVSPLAVRTMMQISFLFDILMCFHHCP